MNSVYQTKKTKDENDILLKDLLERYFFQNFKKEEPTHTLELFLKGTCSAGCKYCYLVKNKNQLYPPDIEKDDNIIKNTELIIKWYIKNKFKCDIDIFAGECITTGLMFKVLDILYDNLFLVSFEYRPNQICIPENCKFIENKELIDKMQEYINKFDEIRIKLCISASVDGKIIENNRRGEESDNYYSKLFNFLEKNNFGVHPMVSVYQIDKWIDNYKWWKENAPAKIKNNLFMLEVRDDNWTEDKIDCFLQFLNFIVEYEYREVYKKDLHSFAKRIAKIGTFSKKNYDNICLCLDNDLPLRGITCALQTSLTIRCGDLAVVPCHRLSYEDYIAGYLSIDEDGKLIDIDSRNVEFYIAELCWNKETGPQCGKCIFKKFCNGPCLGSNKECTGNPFLIGESVCNLHKSKILFLIQKYQAMGVFKVLEKVPEAAEFLKEINKIIKIIMENNKI